MSSIRLDTACSRCIAYFSRLRKNYLSETNEHRRARKTSAPRLDQPAVCLTPSQPSAMLDRLPYELQAAIIDATLDDCFDQPELDNLRKLALTCRSICTIAQTRLYREVGWQYSENPDLLQTLRDNSRLASYVHTVTLDWISPECDNASENNAWLLQRFQTFTATWDICQANLQCLNMDVGGYTPLPGVPGASGQLATFNLTEPTRVRFPELRQLVISSYEREAQPLIANTCLSFLKLFPNVREVLVNRTYCALRS